MPSERNLGGVSTAAVAASRVRFFNFVKFVLPVSGTIRYTDKAGGFVGNIDGGSQTWTAYDLRIGGLAQGMQRALDVSWIELGNENNVWSTIVLNERFQSTPVTIWQAWFDPDTDALLGKYQPYDGRLDLAECGGPVRISIIPHRSGFSQLIPRRVIGPHCGFVYGDPRTCQASGGTIATFPTCDHSRAACRERSNEAHFGGYDLLPKKGEPTTWKPVG